MGKTNENNQEPKQPLEVLALKDRIPSDITLCMEDLKNFFQLTGGSLLYCLSAVFVAYGIVKVMGPILSGGEALKDMLPCIFTLHVYELALLGVFVLIVSRKIVDDAISILILIALFLVGTSMALGTAADKNIPASLWLGLIGIAIAFGKFFVMRRFTKITFKALSIAGLGIVITCNYLGPMLLARSIAVEPTEELARKGLWLLICLIVLIGAVFVLIEAIRGKPRQRTQQNDQIPFLQTPVMVYIFTLIVVIASGVHQYAMAFTFALERVLGDFVPVIAVSSLLLLEILRHYGKRFGIIEIVISCVPLATMMLAIVQKSVLASGQFGIGLMCYPPVILGLIGLAIAFLALYHRWYQLLVVVFAYGLGVILTLGFSPEHPHDLNIYTCIGTLAVALLIYGITIRNQFAWLAGIIILCLELATWDFFSVFAEHYGLTEVGGLAGVGGIGCVAFYLLFGYRLHKAVRIVGVLCLAGFVLDYLPEYIHLRYLAVLLGTILLMAGLWFRTKDILGISILWSPFLIRLYIVAKHIAYWRFVILGFLLLGAGTIVSLLKRPTTEQAGPEKPEQYEDSP